MSQAVAVPAGASTSEGSSCACTRDSWPYILFGLGFGGNVLVCVVAVMAIIGGDTLYIMVNVFLVLFGVIGAAAELRMFKSIRGLMFYVVKYLYFLAKPWGKAFFYLFVASLTWTPDFSILPLLTAILMASVAVLIVLVDIAVGLPMYVDTEMNATIEGAARNIAIDQAKKEVVASAQRI